MAKSKSLVSVEQKEVAFYEDTIVAARLADGNIYIPIRPLCDNLGVTLAGQRERIKRDPVLSEVVTSVSVTLTQQAREMLCLPLKYIPGWLFGINANRVKPELRERIIRYQRECYDVLSEAFAEGRLTADPIFEELLAQDTDAVQAYKVLQAMVKLARNQILLEARLDDHSHALDDHERRLENIEAELHQEDRFITESQATQISQAVRAIAFKITETTGQNEYGRCWGEFYRKFGVSKYRFLSAAKFDEAMKWLNDWYQDLTGETPF